MKPSNLRGLIRAGVGLSPEPPSWQARRVARATASSEGLRIVAGGVYRRGSLILPTVVPAVAWVLTHRVFLERLKGGADSVPPPAR